jgi:hypothetical protein
MRLLAVLLLCCSLAFGATKPEPVYQDAVLKSFRMVSDGENCNTSGHASPDYAGGASTSASTNCTSTQSAYYTISIGDQLLTLTPATGLLPKHGIIGLLSKNSVLYGLLPGTAIQIRPDKSQGKYFIKVGKRESLYRVAAAE